MPEPFQPRHLQPEQLRDLHQRALQQAEGNVANAWLNYVLACAALAGLEGETLLPVPAPPPAPPEG